MNKSETRYILAVYQHKKTPIYAKEVNKGGVTLPDLKAGVHGSSYEFESVDFAEKWAKSEMASRGISDFYIEITKKTRSVL